MTYLNELYHHGILGMKWGVRRYRNEDGSLTPLGKKRYGSMDLNKLSKTLSKQAAKQHKKFIKETGIYGHDSIGKESHRVNSQLVKEAEKHLSTKDYRKLKQDAERAAKRLEDAYNTDDTGELIYKRLTEYTRSNNKLDKYIGSRKDLSYRADKNERVYTKEFFDTWGKKLNEAKLKDMGYNHDSVSFISGILSKNRRLIF